MTIDKPSGFSKAKYGVLLALQITAIASLCLGRPAISSAQDNTPPFNPERGLLEAAKRGDRAAVLELSRQGEFLEARDEMGRTPLILASAEGHRDVVRVLLASGADIDAQGDNGWSALAFAEAEGRPKIVDFRVARGARWLARVDSLESADVESSGSEHASDSYTEPVLASKPREPDYPKRARDEKISGQVVLHIKVRTDGTTEAVRVLKPLLYCTQSAVENARKWRWQPAQKDGKPVEADGIITVTFHLSRDPSR